MSCLPCLVLYNLCIKVVEEQYHFLPYVILVWLVAGNLVEGGMALPEND